MRRGVVPEARLIIVSAGIESRRARSRELALQLADSAHWELLTAILYRRRLLPQLGPRIVEICGERVPARFTEAVEQAVSDTRRQAALLQLVSERLMHALGEAGIASLALKGAFLAEAIYGDPGRRAASDIDLLVAPDDLSAAVEIARRVGYHAPSDHVGGDGLPLLHHSLGHELGQFPPLDLHWRVHWYERDFAHDMLRASVTDPRRGRCPRSVDELACLLLFYARDGFLDLRLATDIGAWWDTFGRGLEPGALEGVLGRYPALARALRAAATVAERVVGVPAVALLGTGFGPGLREGLAARLANPDGRGDPAQLDADVGFVDWLLAPPGGQREFIRRQLLPPRRVLQQRSRAHEERSISPVGHAARVLARYALTMLRSAPWAPG